MSATLSPISQQIWDMKYRLKGADGAPVDKSVEDSWRRIARALAAGEADPAQWEQRFYDALAEFRFLPAGRIVAGAGSGRNVTLFNCFVMGTVPDDMAGIFDALKEAALTMQQGGGIGQDFSTLRPKGAPVHGVGADASGPLSFMDVWDAMCRTIMSAGHRRGAMMATLRCDHPDIEAFIEAKREPGRLRMFNLSVLVTDAFMQAVKNDESWELMFDGTVYKTLSARELWDRIMRATYGYAEPGVIFIDRINRLNNLWYAETIQATNPCVTADTWVLTAEGARQVSDLVGVPFAARIDGEDWASGAEGFFPTGRKPVLRLETAEGQTVRLTADHLVQRVAERTRWRISYEWVPAGTLDAGDEIRLHDHRRSAEWSGASGEDEGYLLGLLVGDGTIRQDKTILSVWRPRRAVNGGADIDGAAPVMARVEAALRRLPHRADFSGWQEVAGRGEWRIASVALTRLAKDAGLAPGRKDVTPVMERASSAFYRGFLRGFFDADGSVQGTRKKGVSVRLAQSDLGRLQAVQRMLARLGVVSTIYRDRRPAGAALLPDGHGGMKPYPTKPQHELVVANDNVARFAERVGFENVEKSRRLTALLAGYVRGLNRERFVARVARIVDDGDAEVFDVAIPGVNAFDAGGIYVHNCGEQPLPPHGACLLGSVNLAKLVRKPFAEDAAMDLEALDGLVRTAVRMLDNSIDVSRYPLPQQAEEARTKRRIGLGITGLGDALILCRARYGSDRALTLTEQWMRVVRDSAYRASIDLAAEKGPFPLFDAERYLEGETIAGLDADIREGIAAHGIRNALVTSVAPTGTISLLADNVSSGLEPVFSFSFRRNVLMPDGSRKSEEVADYAYRLFHRLHGEFTALPDYFVDAEKLTPTDHLRMQAVVQRFVDSSISKTINCPEDIGFEAFKDIYMQAYDLGCKGCTTYRPNDVTGAVLERAPATADAEPELPLEPAASRPREGLDGGAVVYMTQPLERPEELAGSTYKVRWPESDHAIYITINDVVQDGRRRPFEIFINSKNMEHYAWTVGLTRMISAVFRRGGDVSFVVDELKAVFDPRGGQWVAGHYVPSLLAAIGEVIERHLIAIGFMPASGKDEQGHLKQVVGGEGRMRGCPRCGQPSLVQQEGCDVCLSCGYSKCA